MGQLILPSSGVIYINTPVLIYSVEWNPEYYSLLQPLWLKFQTGEIQIISSELILMEALVLPLRNNDTFLLAKAYIFDYGTIYDGKGRALERTEKGIAIVGSSNLTLSGISHNTELNVIIHGNDNHTELTHWFEELWNEAEYFNEALMREMKQSWAGTQVCPYDVYMKTLYSLVKDRLEDTTPKDLILEDEITKQLADFQKVAVIAQALVVRTSRDDKT